MTPEGSKRRIALALAIIAGLLTAAPGPGMAQERFVTAQGRSVRLSPVEAMSCPQLRKKLNEIDETGYRGLQYGARDRRDDRLFAYETEVSSRYYNRCLLIGPAEPGEVFKRGFVSERNN